MSKLPANYPRKFNQQLLAWFDTHGRHDLPWQQDISPYRVWVSEIMLQQTQVTTVIDYFERFMVRFPNVKKLAAANVDEVLHLWSGLGYYARGRNLHKAAIQICEQHNGELPNTLEDMIALPGIGRSTGSAILAIANGQHHAILDGNVKRVLTRLQCISGVPDVSATLKSLWPIAEQLTPKKRVGDYTQAIMDLGATVCTRAKPSCDSCPVTKLCSAYKSNRQHEFPNKKMRKKIPTKAATFLRVVDAKGNVLLNKRPPSGIWGGLWCLPELQDGETPKQWCKKMGFKVKGSPNSLDMLLHTFTHYRLEMHPIELTVEPQPSIIMDADSWHWHNRHKPANLGLAKPMATLIDGRHQQRFQLEETS